MIETIHKVNLYFVINFIHICNYQSMFQILKNEKNKQKVMLYVTGNE